MAKTTFTGPVVSVNGFQGVGVGMTDTLTSGAVTVASHAGKLLKVGSDTDGKITLPTINDSAAGATDNTGLNSGSSIGATFTFVFETAATDLDIKTDGTDKFIGSVANINTTDNAVVSFVPGATNDVMTFNGTTTGGKIGSVVKVTALDDNKYFVEGMNICTTTAGNTATVFADS
jgi:hypothetical protein